MSNASGSASTSSGSGRSILLAQLRSSIPAPCPTEPITSAARACSEAPATVAAVHSTEVISQLRGLGQPRPWAVPSCGMATVSPGRAETNADTRPRPRASWASQPSGRRGTTGAPQPPVSPWAKSWDSTGQSRWQNRLANGADRSQPSAASSGGLAAAITTMPPGSSRSPTTRSSTTLSSAACTAGGAVEISSRKRMPACASASRRAHRGGAKATLPSVTTGSPAKSEGSRMDAITVSHGRSSSRAMALIADVFPVPGAPHSRTGTRAATATPRASIVVCVSDIGPIIGTPWLLSSSHGTGPSGSSHNGSVRLAPDPGVIAFLTAVTAPYVRAVRGRPPRRFFRFLAQPLAAIPAYLVILYTWHLGFAFEGALRHPALHVLQHVSFVLAGVLIWWAAIEPQRRRLRGELWKIPYIFAARMVSMFLGVAFLVSRHPLYHEYYGNRPRA